MTVERSVMVVYGTRPEGIKVAPVIRALEAAPGLRPITVVTGQHREMLEGVHRVFGIVPDHDLDARPADPSLTALAASMLQATGAVIERERPDAVLVHGDTASSTIAALAAFYQRVPVVHLEAGLRSGDLDSPFPEEGDRKVTGQLARLHLAPTRTARDNLLREGVARSAIAVTGNTVIDALLGTVALAAPFRDPRLAALAASGRRIVVATLHRRESWGGGIRAVSRALAELTVWDPETVVVLPMHRNPVVRAEIEAELAGLPSVLLTEPLDYPEFCHLLSLAHCAVTDSGGVQEEAPSLGVPVLVTRTTTERPEAVAAGGVRLVGTRTSVVLDELRRLVEDPFHHAQMSHAVNPYGDGCAAERAVAAIGELLGVGSRRADFVPAAPAAPADPLRRPTVPDQVELSPL